MPLAAPAMLPRWSSFLARGPSFLFALKAEAGRRQHATSLYYSAEEPVSREGSVASSLGDVDTELLRSVNSTLTELPPSCMATKDAQNSWSPIPDPSVFRVRCGPDYALTRRKHPASGESIYDMIAVDVFDSPSKRINIADFLNLPSPSRQGSNSNSTTLPELFIVNYMLPLDAPSFSRASADGPTVSLVFVMRLSEWAKNNENHPSVLLYSRFLANCHEGGNMRQRLKVIAQVCNREELHLNYVVGKLYDAYNALPFLFHSSLSSFALDSTKSCFVATYDSHLSVYSAKMGRYGLIKIAHQICCQVAFVIEAETNEEMPERLLGAALVQRLRLMIMKVS